MGAVRKARVLALSLFSEQYPSIGESHGLSVIAGTIATLNVVEHLGVLDMVQYGNESSKLAVDNIRTNRVNILAIAVGYGTFSVLRKGFLALSEALPRESLVIIGGALPTYEAEAILDDICADSIIVIGEGDVAVPKTICAWANYREEFSDIPNLAFRRADKGGLVRTKRELVDLTMATLPFRGHIAGIAASRGQVFVETSRGCSWAACTFCLRGLSDIHGRSGEYRRKPWPLVIEDLSRLEELGVRDVTIADEDFLGGSIDAALEYVRELSRGVAGRFAIDASMTVQSVYSRRDSPANDAKREELVRELRHLGLRKAFLGVESCAPGQLRRYAKGHTREEAREAVMRLTQAGVGVEIGVILFDPLCTLEEIEDSLEFMGTSGMTGLASGLTSELRIQISSSYLTLLINHEKRTGNRLFGNELNPDTLTLDSYYASEAVAELVAVTRKWNDTVHAIYYPAKSLSRYGSSGALGEHVYEMRSQLVQFREATGDCILAAIRAHRKGENMEAVIEAGFKDAGVTLAEGIELALSKLPSEDRVHPVVARALTSARAAQSRFSGAG